MTTAGPAMTAAFSLGGLLLSLAVGAHAASLCTAPSGRQYIVPGDVTSPLAFDCRPIPEAPAAPRAAASSPSLREAASALGLDEPPAARTGVLVVQASADPARPGESPGLRLVVAQVAPRPMAPPGAELQRVIDDAARRYGHDASLLRSIIHVESRFNANAVSPKGAIGLMQLMPATAARMGVLEPRRTLFDPAANVQAGARYLRLLTDMFTGRLDLAVAAYNAGEGAVLRYKGEVPPFPETQAYVRDVMSMYQRELASRSAP